MKDPGNTAKKLLDLPYAPEAEAYLDELERSGQFRIGPDAEVEELEAIDVAGGNDYLLRRGSGSLTVHDWWTSERVHVRFAAGILPEQVLLARLNDSLLIRTEDGLDRLLLEGYLGLIPDASTLRLEFAEGTVWTGPALLNRIASHLASVSPDSAAPGRSQ